MEKKMQALILKKKIEKINYFLEKIKHNDFLSKKYEKTCKTLNYIEHLHILPSTFTGFVPSSVFTYVDGIPLGIIISEVGLKVWVLTAVIKKYKSIIKKNRQNS